MGFDSVTGNAENLHAFFFKLSIMITKVLAFLSTAGRIILRIKIQQYRTAFIIAEFKVYAAGCLTGKIRYFFAYLYLTHLLLHFCNYSAYSSFAPFRRYFRTQMVTYYYTLTFSVRKCLEVAQNLNPLSS